MAINPHWYIDGHDRFLSDVTPLVTLSVEGDATGYEWAVNAHGDGRGAGDWTYMASGESPGVESAKLAAVEAWRRWAREQAEAAGWSVDTVPAIPDGWVSVEERLPEKGIAVLAVYVSPIRSDRRIDVMMWNGPQGWHNGGAKPITVTHWRPLWRPLPPLPEPK